MTTKNRFRPVRRAVALEPRLLFDGAGAVAGADAFMDADAQGQEHQQDDKTHVAAPVSVTGLEGFPGRTSLFRDSVVGAAFRPAASPMSDYNGVGGEDSGTNIFGRQSFNLMSADVQTEELLNNGLGEKPADTDDGRISFSDKNAGKTILVGEDQGKSGDLKVKIADGISIGGDENKTYKVTVEIGKGKVIDPLFPESGAKLIDDKWVLEGSDSKINAWLETLEYTYIEEGGSEIGDTDTLRVTVEEKDSDDEVVASKTIDRQIDIAPQNDAPIIEDPDDIKIWVDEGGEFRFGPVKELNNGKDGAELGARQDELGLYDPDNIAAQIIIKINTMPGKGNLTLGGVALADGATLSLDRIEDLVYTHNGDQVKDNGQTDTL